ncbi:GFA family protein [Lichenicola cladoniae]|uniref:GFA family protein n=1 Tax=Lichenicola cladoniae TaxID=1484109 RepID=A0A6M8HUQ0_9PROT|nr:GFA family protein [Lichenicola cladoniae]NPD66104.1 GFA family protein [Acetobacteraceae bacterium]QKE91976.1 GFA family protein [Lichenicola cladoniae]
MQARCVCGAVTADLPGPSSQIFACHCLDCQRRTGSPFGVGAYYPAGMVTCSGQVTEFVRPTDAGGEFRTSFCSRCGTSVYWKTTGKPDMIGIAVGAIGDPAYPAPAASLWERSKHPWMSIETASENLPRGWGTYPSCAG